MRRHAKAFVAVSILLASLAIVVASAGASKGVLSYFGSQGTGDGQFETPRGVAVNETGAGAANAGDVYVVDEGNNRIERFDAEGNYLTQFGALGTAEGQFTEPKSIAVNQTTGNVYVTEAGNVRVQAFDAAGSFIWMAGNGVNTGTGNPDLCTDAGAPTDICGAGAAGALGGQLGSIGTLGAGLAVAPAGSPNAGNLLITDPGNSRVQEFTSAGAFVRAYGWDVNSPDGDDAFEECTVVAECLAGDNGTNAGQFDAGQPTSVAEDSTGAVYALERLRLQKFTPQVGPPALNPQGAVDPTNLTGEGEYTLGDVAVGAGNHVFVARTVRDGAMTCPNGSSSSKESFIYEFDSSGLLQDTHMGCASINSNGFGVNANSGLIYVSSTVRNSHSVYILDEIVPPIATIDPVTSFDTRNATFTGTVDPQGSPTEYQFEYSSDGFATVKEGPSLSAGGGSAPVPVEFTPALDSLLPSTEYQVRLLAFKPFGAAGDIAGPVAFTTDPVPPDVGSNASSATNTLARLAAWVNPWGSPTKYHFEYGTAGPCSTNPCASTPDANAGDGTYRVFAHAAITGLKADTDYHYRLVVTSLDGGTVTGPDRILNTSTALPQGRAYEMVSPLEKNGTDISAIPTRTQSASDGNAILFPSTGSFAEANGNAVGSDYFARRTAEGWLVHNITPLQGGEASFFAGNPETQPVLTSDASADLSTGVFFSPHPPGEASGTSKLFGNLYLRDDLDQSGLGNSVLLSDCLSPPAGPCSSPLSPIATPGIHRPEFAFADASDDFTHILFQSEQNLVADAVGDWPKLYEWDHGTVRLAGILPDGTPAICEPGRTCSAPGQGAGTGTHLPGAGGGGAAHMTNTTMSRDGSRVFFTGGPYLGGEGDGDLHLEGPIYMREDHETTIQINRSERTDCSGDPTCGGDGDPDPLPDPNPMGPFGASFWGASDDGSKVVFSTAEQLTDEDHNGPSPGNRNGNDIYLYDLNAPTGGHLTLISQGTNGAPGTELEKVGVTAMSADASYIYFTANQQLIAGEPPITGTGIFAWHQGTVRYLGEAKVGIPIESTLALNRRVNGSRLSASGQVLSFVSAAAGGAGVPVSKQGNLTGFDSYTPNLEQCIWNQIEFGLPEPCEQIYVYDANGGLACASCRQLGAPTGAALIQPRAFSNPFAAEGTHLNRALTEDGKHLFFSSPDPLVPQDTNGHYDAYQYDVGSGQVYLLSTGQCNCDSYFVEASPDGKDAFFVTAERLVRIDTDSQTDLYDARVGGGIAAQNAPPPFECQADACQPAPVSPNDPTPATATSSGPGDPSPRHTGARRCGKGSRKVKRHGKTRCVTRKRAGSAKVRGVK